MNRLNTPQAERQCLKARGNSQRLVAMAVCQALFSLGGHAAHAMSGADAAVIGEMPSTPTAPSTPPVEGSPATAGAYPYTARIESIGNGSPLCSGTQIKPGWIVTASHCVEDLHPKDLRVRTGATEIAAVGRSGIVRQVRDIHIHDRIALLRLKIGQTSCQGAPNDTCMPASYAGESLHVGVPTGSEFQRSRAAGHEGDACGGSDLADGVVLGWSPTQNGDSHALIAADTVIQNKCISNKADDAALLRAAVPASLCPTTAGSALIAFADTGLPFLVGVADQSEETCAADGIAFFDVAEGNLYRWIRRTVGELKDRRYPESEHRPPNGPDSPIAGLRPVGDDGPPPPLPKPRPVATPPPAPAAPPPPASPQQAGALAGATFNRGYSTNLQLSVAAGFTTPAHPLRIAVAWDGQNFEGEQVYDGTVPYVASHAYDSQGMFSLDVTPSVRVTDPAIIGPGGAPWSTTKPAALTLHPVYDISFSPLQSGEYHRSDWAIWYGNCDVGSRGEGTLHWSSIYNDDFHASAYVQFPGDPVYRFEGDFWFTEPVQTFARTYHVDTAVSGPVDLPRIQFTEDEVLWEGPWKWGSWGVGGLPVPGPLFPFKGDNGTDVRSYSHDVNPADTHDNDCRIRIEYDVRVQLDLTPGDADSPPPLGSPAPPPPTGGGGGAPQRPGGGGPPIQEQ